MTEDGRPATRLLRATLRPERRAVSALLAILLSALALRLTMPYLLGVFVDRAIDGRPTQHLMRVAAAYVGAALLAEGLQLWVTWGSVNVSWRSGNRLREQLADRASRLEMAWHGRHSPGQLIERIDGDVEAMVTFFANVVVHVVGNVILTIAMLAVAFFIDVRAGAVLLVFSVIGTLLMVRLRTAAVPAREAEREANAVLYGDLEERLGGLEDLRANGAGRFAVHRLQVHSARTWHAARRASYLSDGSYAIATMAFAAGSVAILALGFVLFRERTLTVGAVLTLFRYSELVRQPLEHIAEQMKEFQKALAGARRAATLLATASPIADGPLGPDALPHGALSVEFDGVGFAYDAGRIQALDDVHLHLEPGQHLGVIGRTGSGKTTLGRLLLRFWDVGAGAVRVGGVDVRDLHLAVLRHRIVVVTQDVELFRGSLRDNLTLFGARQGTDDGALREVLGHVGLGRWLDALPSGLDTPVHGSMSLSAGEAQLLAFARAFLAEPDVVVLDEASSRLDPGTEARIAAATRELLAGRTAVIVAHRLATLDQVDRIVVLDRGRVVEHGTRSALASDPASRYAELLRLSRDGLLVDGELATP